MAKLTTYENPLTGKKENLLDFSGWLQKIIGVVVLFIVIAAGQNVAKLVSNKVGFVDTTIDPIVQPAVAAGPSISWH